MAVSARQLAMQILRRIEDDGAYSHIVLSSALTASALEERDRNLVTELVYGTLTHQRTIDAILAPFLKRPLLELDGPVRLALRLALYQLVYLDRIPVHAIVDEAVQVTKLELGKGASGFVNGVLRQMLRNRNRWRPYDQADRHANPARYLGERYSLPDWIARRMIDSHGLDRAEAMAEAYNLRPPLYLHRLESSDQALPPELEPVHGVPGALKAMGMTTAIREGLQQHRWIVQDLGSQLITHFLEPHDGTSLLDGCAGLGGKTLHLMTATSPDARIDAVEPFASKLALLKEVVANRPDASRIQLHTSTLQRFLADSNRTYDRILIDAPCSGLGVLRRHPETRWRRTESDIESLVGLQRELLETAAPHLSPQGVLVYSVCTFTHEEGPGQIDQFLNEHKDFQRLKPTSSLLDWSGFSGPHGDLYLNPMDHDSDGFYAARLTRSPVTG
jgi:16S rRNA (cytosine967-C5)-methyltransferase